MMLSPDMALQASRLPPGVGVVLPEYRLATVLRGKGRVLTPAGCYLFAIEALHLARDFGQAILNGEMSGVKPVISAFGRSFR
jgi:hypothetical protein